MIERYVNDDALNAHEQMLLVPTPIGETTFEERFIGQVIHRFPDAAERIDSYGGLNAGDIVVMGALSGEANWVPTYSLVFAGIHRRREAGWNNAPALLSGVLDKLYIKYNGNKLATAGIPGSGYSGLRGNALPASMEEVLRVSPLDIVVYNRGLSGDRVKLREADPQLDTYLRLQHII